MIKERNREREKGSNRERTVRSGPEGWGAGWVRRELVNPACSPEIRLTSFAMCDLLGMLFNLSQALLPTNRSFHDLEIPSGLHVPEI